MMNKFHNYDYFPNLPSRQEAIPGLKMAGKKSKKCITFCDSCFFWSILEPLEILDNSTSLRFPFLANSPDLYNAVDTAIKINNLEIYDMEKRFIYT